MMSNFFIVVVYRLR